MRFETVLEILGAIVTVFHVAGFAFAGHAILFGRTSQGAIAWALSLIFVPYVAVPTYVMFGRQKFHGYVEARRAGDRRIDHLSAELERHLCAYRCERAARDPRLGDLEKLAKLPFARGHSVRLLVDGQATFEAVFEAIRQAREYVLVQFFILRNDAVGRALRDLLVGKVRSGVQVYILFDPIGCIRLPEKYWAPLRSAGGRVQAFRNSRGWRNPFQINFRNHRKVVIVDGEVALVGGHNVGDEYLGKSKRFGRWRDTHVEMRGPAVASVQFSFLQDWHWATGETPELRWETGEVEVGELVGSAVGRGSEAGALERPRRGSEGKGVQYSAGAAALVIPSGPADEIETATMMFLSAITSARRRLWITSPYFVPDETVYDALQLAALRGVDVRIMLPDRPDHLLVYLSAFSYLQSAAKVGVKFYRYGGGFLHQKVVLVDDDLAAVGTANLDNRSLRLNFEITTWFADRGVAAEVERMLEADFAKCRLAGLEDLMRRGLGFRVAVRIARLLSPVQ